MLNVWDKSKLVVYFEDDETDKFVPYTMSHLINKPTPEKVKVISDAVDALTELPLTHLIVTENQRYII